MALGWQALEAQKGRKPLEQGGALEQVAARIERVMGLTPRFSGGPAKRGRPLEPFVGHITRRYHSANRMRSQMTVRTLALAPKVNPRCRTRLYVRCMALWMMRNAT